MSAAEDIEPITIRLNAQCLAVELSASATFKILSKTFELRLISVL